MFWVTVTQKGLWSVNSYDNQQLTKNVTMGYYTVKNIYKFFLFLHTCMKFDSSLGFIQYFLFFHIFIYLTPYLYSKHKEN